MSSACHPMSNTRAELAVKTTKLWLMENVGSNGEVNSNRKVKAFFMQRNTPDSECNLFLHRPFGIKFRGLLLYIRRVL